MFRNTTALRPTFWRRSESSLYAAYACTHTSRSLKDARDRGKTQTTMELIKFVERIDQLISNCVIESIQAETTKVLQLFVPEM